MTLTTKLYNIKALFALISTVDLIVFIYSPITNYYGKSNKSALSDEVTESTKNILTL